MSSVEKRCKQCGRILVTDSKMGLCPKCAEKDVKRVGGVAVGAVSIGVVIKKIWKLLKFVRKV